MRFIASLAILVSILNSGCVSVKRCRQYAQMRYSTGYLQGLAKGDEFFSTFRKADCQMEILERTVELDAKHAACEAVLESCKKLKGAKK